jgi:hypothetical protein
MYYFSNELGEHFILQTKVFYFTFLFQMRNEAPKNNFEETFIETREEIELAGDVRPGFGRQL